jgi:hypothetical protein
VLHYIRVSKFATSKHSGLLDQFVSYKEKSSVVIHYLGTYSQNFLEYFLFKVLFKNDRPGERTGNLLDFHSFYLTLTISNISANFLYNKKKIVKMF